LEGIITKVYSEEECTDSVLENIAELIVEQGRM